MASGRLRIAEEQLRFKPYVYPSNRVREHGFTWDRDVKEWYAAATRDRLARVLSIFPDTIMDDTVRQWLESFKASEAKPSEPATIQADGLYSYQRESIEFLKHNSAPGRGALLALAPGLGKTVCAIRAAEETNKQHVLIVAPLSLLYNWRNEIVKWTGCSQDAVDIVHKVQPTNGKRWTVTNYDTLRTKPPTCHYDCVVLDESVLVKNREAQRTRSAWALMDARRRTTCVWLLSGAPITKFYDDMWSQLRTIDRARFSSYWRFARTYCIVDTNQWGTGISGNLFGSEQRLKTDLADIYLGRTQDDVLDLPEFLFENVEVVLGDAQAQAYTEMEERLVTQLEELGDTEVVAANTLVQMLRLVQLASSPALVGGHEVSAKVDALVDQLQFLDKPAIVWTSFIATADLVQRKLLAEGYTVRKLTGATPPLERQEIVDAFQAGALDIIVAHPAVGKFGLTLTKGRTAIYLERGYSGDDYYQSLYRIRRIGTTHRPHVLHLLAIRRTNGRTHGTVDHVIDRVLRSRYDSVQRLTAGDLRTAFRDL